MGRQCGRHLLAIEFPPRIDRATLAQSRFCPLERMQATQ
jgi:hypothetical protein